MKSLKKLMTIVMAMAMMFAFAGVAMAADQYVVDTEGQTGTVTVYFTKNCTESNNDGQHWYGLDEGTALVAGHESVTVNIADLNGMVKGYVPAGTENPFGNKVSVLDAIYSVNGNGVFTIETGWDAEPYEGDPGAYVQNVNEQDLESDYFVEDGTAYSIGTGFVVATAANANATPTFSDIYLSNVALEDGMVIYVDLGYYDYSWSVAATR